MTDLTPERLAYFERLAKEAKFAGERGFVNQSANRLSKVLTPDVVLALVEAARERQAEELETGCDDTRVAWSQAVPGHTWDPVGRICECGVEVGVRCDTDTVEEHLTDATWLLAVLKERIEDALDRTHRHGEHQTCEAVREVLGDV